MQRYLLLTIGAALMMGCAPQVPDSARGAGFASIEAGQARDAALQGSQYRVPDTVLPPEGGTGAPPPVSGVAPLPGSAEATAAETARVLEATRPGAVPAAENAAPLNAGSTAPVLNNSGISNENNFDAVSGERSIEGDAERLAQNRAQYRVIQPEALPQRAGSNQPNIVAFALSTSHPVGTRVYARAGLNGASRAERNCAQYPSPDQAQIEFLASGGPARDRRGLDPDGDGYACSWNPEPFRKASQG
ncbi:MAG: hypothetical protein AAF665_10375 [Pseudomonadota bacterium]